MGTEPSPLQWKQGPLDHKGSPRSLASSFTLIRNLMPINCHSLVRILFLESDIDMMLDCRSLQASKENNPFDE